MSSRAAALPVTRPSACRAARDTTWRMPQVVTGLKVSKRKKVTSWSVITWRTPGVRIGATLARLWMRSARYASASAGSASCSAACRRSRWLSSQGSP